MSDNRPTPSDLRPRAADIQAALRAGRVPAATLARLEAARTGRVPWIATLTPPELLVVRSHGLRPIAAISATCWISYGWSWAEAHAEGWNAALARLKAEAKAAGANAVLDVKMRTIPLDRGASMDFTLIGTAARIEGLPPSSDPIVATVPALEFVKLLDSDIVPTGLAVGAQYEWLNDWYGSTNQATFAGNVEMAALSQFWQQLRSRALAELRRNAKAQGSGVLAHVNFGQMLKFESDGQPTRFLGRQIIVATTLDSPAPASTPWGPIPEDEAKARPVVAHPVAMVVDLHPGRTPLVGHPPHHQSYASNEQEGAI